ncbi:adenylate/guanylate cyclase domain-containing protein [soil metagenome]
MTANRAVSAFTAGAAVTAVRHHWPRIVITLLPVLLAFIHAAGVYKFPFVDRLDLSIYDVRLRATLPRTLDPRVVIVDIDDPSLQEFGQWPWSRDKLAALTTELIDRQQAAVLGFDVMFAEPDGSSGLAALRQIAAGALRDVPGLKEQVDRLAPELDHDAIFANVLKGRPVALGYYFTQTDQPRGKGWLPSPVFSLDAFPPGQQRATSWNGFGGSIALLADATSHAGFLNVLIETDGDGIVRAAPVLAQYDGTAAKAGYYESLGLAMYRLVSGMPSLVVRDGEALLAKGSPAPPAPQASNGKSLLRLPVDARGSVQVPYRGAGGARGGSFRYVPAADVLNGKLAAAELKGKIVLVGATAPGLQDLRSTPVGAAFPGVEVHANIISGLLDRRLTEKPDYAAGYSMVVIAGAGLILALGLSIVSAARAVLIAAATVAVVIGLNTWLYIEASLVLPLAATLVMCAVAFVLNLSWGYFVEARERRSLAQLFGTYVPPQLVQEMLASPGRYSMRAVSKELTVLFCDMRGFTEMSESMAPTELQQFLNSVFSRLTEIISAHRGTVDKYMGDCVMAFWGAPVDTPDHADLAVAAALEMAAAVHAINDGHRASGQPAISVGIGINTGVMSVGDMGSAVRRSYTVVGDAVNLASRLESLSGIYGAEVVVSDATRHAAPAFVWQELDRVRVKGKAQSVAIFAPLGRASAAAATSRAGLDVWQQVLTAYRAQDWALGRSLLTPLLAPGVKKVLYQLYAERLASMALRPKDPDWDGATRFESK